MIITGTPGTDFLSGTPDDDIINALDGSDFVNGNGGNDTISGGLGNDILDGGAGNDVIHGDAGNDSITGGAGINALFGDDGNDRFDGLGAIGQDGTTADGGAGNDIFMTFAENITITTGAGSDRLDVTGAAIGHKLTITDFTVGFGGDILDLSTMLVISATGWSFGTNPFATGFLRLVQNGADTDVQWDRNGATGGADFTTFITLQNVTASTLAPVNLVPKSTSNVFSPPPPPLDQDFNADGLGDLFLFSDRGDSAIWTMNQNQRLGSGSSLPFNGPTWHLKAAADFDGVGSPYSDLVWQNDNGAIAVWQMNGGAIVGQANLLNPGAGTQVIGARDFDGNGGADILLQDRFGQVSLLFMQDATHVETSGQRLVIQNPGAPWHARAVGDFNGDGRAGIIFTTDSGATAIWDDYSGGSFRFTVQANLPSNGPTWHMKATGDFDGDRKDDILWQNDNGLAAVWLMDGVTIKAGFNIAGSDANGPTWHIANARDMNADGRADILWQNDNGAVALWENFEAHPGNVATFGTQLNVAPNVNPDGHLFWHVM